MLPIPITTRKHKIMALDSKHLIAFLETPIGLYWCSQTCSTSVNCNLALQDTRFGLWCLTPFSTICRLYRVGSVLLVGDTRRKPPTCRKSLTNYHIHVMYRVYMYPLVSEIRTTNLSGDGDTRRMYTYVYFKFKLFD